MRGYTVLFQEVLTIPMNTPRSLYSNQTSLKSWHKGLGQTFAQRSKPEIRVREYWQNLQN